MLGENNKGNKTVIIWGAGHNRDSAHSRNCQI